MATAGSALAAVLAVCAGVVAAPAPKSAEVAAAGNPFTGGLAFEPAAVRVRVGGSVSWTNTDPIVPHTSTEDHNLWRLSGDYGLPGNMGYGPGERVSRRFAAGTWSYFCEIHPEPMKGTVAVPVSLANAAAQRPGRRRGAVVAVWARESLPSGQVFDVQRRRDGEPWRSARSGVRARRGLLQAPRGSVLSIRARVRLAEDPSARSGWSPPAKIRVG